MGLGLCPAVAAGAQRWKSAQFSLCCGRGELKWIGKPECRWLTDFFVTEQSFQGKTEEYRTQSIIIIFFFSKQGDSIEVAQTT